MKAKKLISKLKKITKEHGDLNIQMHVSESYDGMFGPLCDIELDKGEILLIGAYEGCLDEMEK